MEKRTRMGLSLGALAALALSATASGPLVLREDGIQFPDGSLLTTAPATPANLVIVAKRGGHYSSIQAALDSISDASEANPYLVWIAPGIYSEQVTMKEWVDIQGAGEGVTKITYTGGSSADSATLKGADNAELRSLTVEVTGGVEAVAIYNNVASPRLTRVTAIASGDDGTNTAVFNRTSAATMTHVTATATGGTSSYGVYNFNASSTELIEATASASGASNRNRGVFNSGSSPKLIDVAADASGGNSSIGVLNLLGAATLIDVTASASGATDENAGVRNGGTALTMTNVTATAAGGSTTSYGLYSNASSPTTIQYSRLSGADYAIYLDSTIAEARVAHTQLSGGAGGAGSYSCIGVWDENFEPLYEQCQPLGP